MSNAKIVDSRGPLGVMLFSGVYIQLAGRLFVAELMFFSIFLSLVFRGKLAPLLRRAEYSLVLKLLFLCLIGQLTSDVVRHSQNFTLIKGFLLVSFTIINLIVITYIVQFKLKRYLIVIFFYSISTIISYLFQPQLFGFSNIWKFGLGYPLTAIFFCWLTYKTTLNHINLGLLCLALGSLDFALGARNLAATTVTAGFLSAIARFNAKKSEAQAAVISQGRPNNSMPIRSLTGILFLLTVLGIILFMSYRSAAVSGLLGQDAALKYARQSTTGTNLIFSSRSEVFSQYLAIRESPLIGHGSYAPLTSELRDKLLPWLLQNRLQTNLAQLESGINYVIPVHSGLFGFWVWFGILSVPFFLFTFWRAISTIRTRESLPIVYYFAVLICWDIFFSPFGMYARMQYPLTLIGMLIFSKRSEAH